jgi:hypothetical protein
MGPHVGILFAMRRAIAVSVILSMSVLAGCTSGASTAGRAGPSSPSTAAAVATTGPQLPPRVLGWLRNYAAHSSPGRATSASWVLTTHDKSGPFLGGAIFPDTTLVYLFDIEGHFVLEHSCLPRSPRSACVSVGGHEVLTLDSHLLQIKDFGVDNKPVPLARLGTVGHVAL